MTLFRPSGTKDYYLVHQVLYEPGEVGGRYSWQYLIRQGRMRLRKSQTQAHFAYTPLRVDLPGHQVPPPGNAPQQSSATCGIIRRYKDAELTEMGEMQAAGLVARLAVLGFRPDLAVPSPLTRRLDTAALVFPMAFLAVEEATPQVKVLGTLFPKLVHSWGDTGRPLGDDINGGSGGVMGGGERDPKLHLEPFRGTQSRSRFQKVHCNSNGPPRGCWWQQIVGVIDNTTTPLANPPSGVVRWHGGG